jgi:superfamily II DNA or RNA helicase
MIEIVVDNRVRVREARSLPVAVRAELAAAFDHANPQYSAKRAMGVALGGEPERYVTWREEPDGGWSFPRGGMSRVRAALRCYRVGYEVADMREGGDLEPGYAPVHKFTLRDYQRQAVAAVIARENCLLRAATGAGKTSCGFAVHAQLRVPTIVVVWSGALFDQWIERAEIELGLKGSDVGVIRGSERRLRPLTIAMQQTLAAAGGVDDELKDYFGCLVADEVQRFSAPTFFACIDPFPARWRIGISADQRRKDRKEFLVHDLFGAVAHEIPYEQLVGSGHVLDVEVRVVRTGFEAPWYADDRDFGRLLTELTDPAEDAGGAEAARRNQQIVDLAVEEARGGAQVVVMTHRRDHARLLDSILTGLGLRTGFLVGGQGANAREFAATKEGLKNRRVQVGLATVQAFGQGIDVPTVEVAIVATPIAANEQLFGQVRGRVCRPSEGKTGARLYYLWDAAVFPRHLSNLERWARTVIVGEVVSGGWSTPGTYDRRAERAGR